MSLIVISLAGTLIGYLIHRNRQLFRENQVLKAERDRSVAGRDWDQSQYLQELSRHGVPPTEAMRRVWQQ